MSYTSPCTKNKRICMCMCACVHVCAHALLDLLQETDEINSFKETKV